MLIEEETEACRIRGARAPKVCHVRGVSHPVCPRHGASEVYPRCGRGGEGRRHTSDNSATPRTLHTSEPSATPPEGVTTHLNLAHTTHIRHLAHPTHSTPRTHNTHSTPRTHNTHSTPRTPTSVAPRAPRAHASGGSRRCSRAAAPTGGPRLVGRARRIGLRVNPSAHRPGGEGGSERGCPQAHAAPSGNDRPPLCGGGRP